MKLLRATAIAHHYDYLLFEDVNVELAAKERIAIIGKSGSGKSTLLHILCDLLRPDRGRVELFGKEVAKLKPKELAKLKREDLGIIFQSHYLFKGFSVYENLKVASMLSGKPIDRAMLARLGIEQTLAQKVTELSGGQQQRVSIARVLTKKPRIIYADEPTGNLDRETASVVMALLFEYCQEQNAALVLVTHDEELARRCDRVYRLQDQRLMEIS